MSFCELLSASKAQPGRPRGGWLSDRTILNEDVLCSAFIMSYYSCQPSDRCPSCFGTHSPRSALQPQLQGNSLHQQAPSAQMLLKLRAKAEDELRVLKRIDLVIAPYFHRFAPYSGQWERRPSSNPNCRGTYVEFPQGPTAYTSWVLEGAMSFLCDFDHDVKQMAGLVADIRPGTTNPAVPNIPVPLFSQPSRTTNPVLVSSNGS